MQKLRIDRKDDIYEIEVNDKGETIQFDLADIELPFKLQRAYDGVRKAQNKLKSKMVIIEKQQDKKDKRHILSKNEEDSLKAWKECFIEMRSAMDEFIGEGGCQKIFGDANYLEMFDDLFAELEKKNEDGFSHIEHLKISQESIVDRIKSKYHSKDDETI